MNSNSNNPIFFYEHEFYVFSNFLSFMLGWKGKLWMEVRDEVLTREK